MLYSRNLVRMDASHKSELAQAHPRLFSVTENVEAELCFVRVKCGHISSVRMLWQVL